MVFIQSRCRVLNSNSWTRWWETLALCCFSQENAQFTYEKNVMDVLENNVSLSPEKKNITHKKISYVISDIKWHKTIPLTNIKQILWNPLVTTVSLRFFSTLLHCKSFVVFSEKADWSQIGYDCWMNCLMKIVLFINIFSNRCQLNKCWISKWYFVSTCQ